MLIPDDVIPIVEGGVAGWLASCSTAGLPEATRVRGSRVAAGGDRVTAFVPTLQAGVTFENLSAHPRIALFYFRVTDYAAVQLKGEVVEVRAANDEDRAWQARHMAAFIEDCFRVGVPRELVGRHIYWPSVAVELRVDAVFQQTPGPQAGHAWPRPR